MSFTEHKTRDELEKLIDKAIKKVQGTKENNLCRYLPGDAGSHMHHFTLRKLKHRDPEQLLSLIKKFILETEKPTTLNSKPRAPRGSRKQTNLIRFNRADLEKILDLAKKIGDKDLLARFSPKRSLPTLKRELIHSIKKGVVDQDLWTIYTNAIVSSTEG